MTEWSPWTDADIDRVDEMWKEGHSASVIAGQVKRSRNAVLGLMNRYRDRFPKRGKGSLTARSRPVPAPSAPSTPSRRSNRTNAFNAPVLRKPRAIPVAAPKAIPAPAPEQVPVQEPPAPIWADGYEKGAKADLSRYRRTDAEPKSFVSLDRFECRFPLVCFEAASGPDMPCCGARTERLASYCDAHIAVMAGRG